MSKNKRKQLLIEKTRLRKLETKIEGIRKTHGTNETAMVTSLAQFMAAYARKRVNKAVQEIKHERPISVIAYCKNCKQPRAIMEGICPGCLKNGEVTFDSEVEPLKEMSEIKKPRIVRAKRKK